MSALARSYYPHIFVDPNNNDVFDTLAMPIVKSLPIGNLPDTPENRLSAALAVSYQLGRKVARLQNKVSTLEGELDDKVERLEGKILELRQIVMTLIDID